MQAVIGGNVHIGYAGVPPILSAIARGAPAVVVAVPNNKMDYLIVSRRPIAQPSELNGKKFAISSFGSSSEFAARLGLEKVGADPNSVTMVQVGGSPERIVALKTGAVDATILSATEFCRNIRTWVPYHSRSIEVRNRLSVQRVLWAAAIYGGEKAGCFGHDQGVCPRDSVPARK